MSGYYGYGGSGYGGGYYGYGGGYGGSDYGGGYYGTGGGWGNAFFAVNNSLGSYYSYAAASNPIGGS